MQEIKRLQLLLVLLFVMVANLSGQSVLKKFKTLPLAEKRWVLFHLRHAKDVYALSIHCKQVSENQCNIQCVDSVSSGGTLDAFRHCFWMANLAQVYSEQFCRRLGQAHEKGNYQYYKKHKLEDNLLPDLASKRMDLFNNEVGIQIGEACQSCSDEELIFKVHDAIQTGQLLVINKTIAGAYVLENGDEVAPMLIKPLWDNGKTTIPSKCLD